MKIGAVILAAGASSRMGTPKALLKVGGKTFIARLVELYSEFCDPVVVVLGYHAAKIGAALAGTPAKVLENPDPARGMLSSLQCGLDALPDGLDAFLFTPCDYPAVRRDTVAKLVHAKWGKIRMPRHNGRQGHPVLCLWPLRAQFLRVDPARDTAKDVVNMYRYSTCRIDVEDAGTVTDIDTPEDYQKLVAAGAARP